MSSNHESETISEKLQTAESQATDTGEDEFEKTSKKRKTIKRSSAWDYFKIVRSSSTGPTGKTILEEKAQCIFCKGELNCNSKNNGTSGLLYHVKRCKENPINRQKSILSLTPSDEASGGGLKTWSFDKEAVRKALALMIMVDELPLSFVEHAGFQHFMRVACPLFSIPSRRTEVRDCYMLYEEEKTKLKALLKKSAQRVCFTTDTWTSLQRINYLCLTAHFIDKNWNLNKRILSFVPINSHKGDDIGIVIEQCLADWEIEEVFTMTVDNAASNSTALAYLRRKFTQRNRCLLGGKYMHMRCIAHIVNLMVQDGLKSMKSSVARIRKAVKYVKQSPSRWAKFKECIVIEKIDSQSHVSLDVRTRWNSTYLMLESAVKFESAFERLSLLDPCFAIEMGSKSTFKSFIDANGDEFDVDIAESYDSDEDIVGIPKKSDWENAKKFVSFLGHFYKLTVKVSGTKYVTSNIFFTEISGVLYQLDEWQRNGGEDVVDIAARMKKKYEKYWGKLKQINMLVYFAVVLDPRYKFEFLRWTLIHIYKSSDRNINVEEVIETVKTSLYEIFNEYMRINNCGVEGSKEQTATTKLQSNLSGSDAKGSSELEKLYMMHKSKAHIEENRTELDTYLKEDAVELNEKFDILSWWKNHNPRFPILSQLARDILAIPISTVASESAFSTGGRVLDAFRSSLSTQMVQVLICTQDWIRSRTSQPQIIVEEDSIELEKLDDSLVKLIQEERFV